MPIENKEGGSAAGDKNLDTQNKGDGAAAAAGDQGGAEGADKGADEVISVKKSEFEKIKKERGDFEQGLKIANDKLKGKKDDRTVATDANNQSEFVTKKDLYKTNEKLAISQATTISKDDTDDVKAVKKDLDEHWDEIKPFYTGKSGKDTPAEIVEDLMDAHAIWKRRASGKTTKADDKGARADLSNDRGNGGRSPAAAGERRKRILPQFSKPTDWYKKPEAK